MATDKPLAEILQCKPGTILVQVKKAEEINKAGLWLTEASVKELQGPRPTQGVVVAVGGEVEDDEELSHAPLFCAIGDRVIFGKFSGVEMTYGRGDRVILLKDSDVLAKYKEEPTVEVKVT